MLEWLIVGSLLTWRITSLLVKEDGPADVLAKFRDKAGVRFDEHSLPVGSNVVAQALCCMWCASVWIGWLVAVLVDWRTAIYMGLAYSAGAMLIGRGMRQA